jgi:hypothetical protein
VTDEESWDNVDLSEVEDLPAEELVEVVEGIDADSSASQDDEVVDDSAVIEELAAEENSIAEEFDKPDEA